MAKKITSVELKALRKSRGISIKRAAKAVNRSIKSWQDYESDAQDKTSIPTDIFSRFLAKFKITWPHAKVVSITAYKGGIGKSPITIAVAGLLANTGLKVAVVTNDEVYRSYTESEISDISRSDKLASKIDFYDELDIAMYDGEVLRLEEDIKRQAYQASFQVSDAQLNDLSRKQSATSNFDDLKDKYDLIFLDINRTLDQTVIKSDTIVVLTDLTCAFAFSSTRSYHDHITNLNGDKLESVHLLYTNFSSLPQISYDLNVSRARKNRFVESCLFRAELTLSNYRKIQKLNIPSLKSRLSADYDYHISLHNSSEADDFGYFDTVMDIRNESLAAVELAELAHELSEIIWQKGFLQLSELWLN
ncbi:AAA family ATPase [Pseudomonas graminis]|uniref:AAA family ATPase n=1 Tax=Pseudomonas graminis TaxID=158627 RepID=UPI00234B11CD|nr:AAA family ATPase [Pseudomonas graminis]MDC6379862.1 AAA family ATPase [Pseudomonas graminis]